MENISCPKKVVNKTGWFYTFFLYFLFFFFYFSQQVFVKVCVCVCVCVLCMHVDVYILKWNLTSLVSNYVPGLFRR